jgi:hypothetical protein
MISDVGLIQVLIKVVSDYDSKILPLNFKSKSAATLSESCSVLCRMPRQFMRQYTFHILLRIFRLSVVLR